MVGLHQWSTTVLFAMLLSSQAAFADSVVMFDFNQLPPSGRKHQGSSPTVIESYMEGVYGSDITVGPGVQAATSATKGGHKNFGPVLSAPNIFLTNGKGRNSGVSLTFGADPIDSFAVDWGVRKSGRGIIIKADGVIIYQHLLTKGEKKTAVLVDLGPFIFDQPVQTLQFIGMRRTKLTIDNLAVNFQQGNGDTGGGTSTGSGPGLSQDRRTPSDPPTNTGDLGNGDTGGGTGTDSGPGLSQDRHTPNDPPTGGGTGTGSGPGLFQESYFHAPSDPPANAGDLGKEGTRGGTSTGSGPGLFQESYLHTPSDPPTNAGDLIAADAAWRIGAGGGPNDLPITITDVFVTGLDIQQTDGRVPEPASWIMLGLGLLAVGVSKKLRRDG